MLNIKNNCKIVYIFKNVFTIVLFGFVIFFIYFIVSPFSEKSLYPKDFNSIKILDRNGIVLREVLSGQNGISKYLALKDMSPFIIDAVIISEDKRFYKHSGVDSLAIIRAAYQNVVNRKIISGASTITMQLVRNSFDFNKQNLLNKIVEILYAVKLERHISKDRILELYLNKISFGNQLFGIDAASRTYFNKPTLDLSIAQAAFLASIPQAPSTYDPLRSFNKVKLMQRAVLKNMFMQGKINHKQFKQALNEKITIVNLKNSFLAPHFCDFILEDIKNKDLKNNKVFHTTLDMAVQSEVENILKKNITLLKKHGVTNGAVIVMKNDTGEILAMAGSVDYFNLQNGQVNGAVSLRQPGSAVKPFMYALALENRFKASDVIPDIETHIQTDKGDFTPKNYDEEFHGPVRLRVALASSYNVPAVRVLEKIGYDNLYNKLHEVGIDSLNKPSSFYGLGLTLGSGEVTLLELVRSYASFARGGIYKKEIILLDDLYEEEDNGKKVFSERVSYIITDILSDNNARSPSFGTNSALSLPFKCAAKTGTSKSFRDNWTVGYTPRYTVGVWVGNFDGKPMYNVSGISGAAPIFRDVMLFLENKSRVIYFDKPGGIVSLKVCPLSGAIPGRYCPNFITEIFIAGNEPKQICSFHKKIQTREGEKVYEVYPSLYYPWMKKRSIEIHRSVADEDRFFQKQNNSTDNASVLQIVYPNNGDIFRIDPHLKSEYQSIALKVTVPEGTDKITWFVDDVKVKESAPLFTFLWKLEPGEHKFVVKTNKEESSPVTIKVY